MKSNGSLKNDILKTICDVLLPDLEKAYKVEAALFYGQKSDDTQKDSALIYARISKLLHELDLLLCKRHTTGLL